MATVILVFFGVGYAIGGCSCEPRVQLDRLVRSHGPPRRLRHHERRVEPGGQPAAALPRGLLDRAGLLDLRRRPAPDRGPDARRLRHRGVAVPVRRDDRLHDHPPAGVPRGRPRAPARDRRRRGATAPDRAARLPVLRLRGREVVPALPELPAPAQGAVRDVRQAARPALEDLPVLRGRGGPRSAASSSRPSRRREAPPERRPSERAAPRRAGPARAPPRPGRQSAPPRARPRSGRPSRARPPGAPPSRRLRAPPSAGPSGRRRTAAAPPPDRPASPPKRKPPLPTASNARSSARRPRAAPSRSPRTATRSRASAQPRTLREPEGDERPSGERRSGALP